MTKTKLHSYIIAALIVVVLILLWIVLVKANKPNRQPNNDFIISGLITRLKEQSAQSEKIIVELKKQNIHHLITIDSLNLQKQKVEYVYLYKIKYIENYTTDQQVNEYKTIFNKNQIK